MGSVKSVKEKEKIAKGIKQNRLMPLFVVAKTNRRVARNKDTRSWRRQKLKMRSVLKRDRINQGKKK